MNGLQEFSAPTPSSPLHTFASGLDWDSSERRKDPVRGTSQSGLPLRFVDGAPVLPKVTARQNVELISKRLLDVVLSGIALAFLFPLFAIIAAAIKVTSPGPVFFVQEREGLNGRRFRCFKFRSMHVASGDVTGVTQTVKDDPRVFGLGKLLRRTSIDELPQLINVLIGDMSLVGPRPHVPGMRAGGMLYRELVPYYDTRLVVAPGITGWAQVNGLRGPTDNAVHAKARIDHDIAYVANYSLWLDVKIILMTVIKEFVVGSGH